jgi:hypothetical protein
MPSRENFVAELLAYAREQEVDPAPLLLLLAWTGMGRTSTDLPNEAEALPDHYYPH